MFFQKWKVLLLVSQTRKWMNCYAWVFAISHEQSGQFSRYVPIDSNLVSQSNFCVIPNQISLWTFLGECTSGKTVSRDEKGVWDNSSTMAEKTTESYSVLRTQNFLKKFRNQFFKLVIILLNRFFGK